MINLIKILYIFFFLTVVLKCIFYEFGVHYRVNALELLNTRFAILSNIFYE